MALAHLQLGLLCAAAAASGGEGSDNARVEARQRRGVSLCHASSLEALNDGRQRTAWQADRVTPHLTRRSDQLYCLCFENKRSSL